MKRILKIFSSVISYSSDNYISKEAKIGADTIIGKGTNIIGAVSIGKKCIIGKNSTIKGDVMIDDGCTIGDNVTMNEYMSGKIIIKKKSAIHKNVDLGGNIFIGENTVVASNTLIKTMPGGLCKIGNDVLINSFTIIGASKLVEIRDHCIFAAFVQIIDASHIYDNINIPIKHSKTVFEETCIEEDVWLGSGVAVLMGCTIGKGSVIGAKALVTESIPPYSVAYGIPAKVQKSRI